MLPAYRSRGDSAGKPTRPRNTRDAEGLVPRPGFPPWTPVLGFRNEDDLPRRPARGGPLRGLDGGVYLAEDSGRSKGVGCPAPTSPPDRVSMTRLSSTTRADSDSSSI